MSLPETVLQFGSGRFLRAFAFDGVGDIEHLVHPLRDRAFNEPGYAEAVGAAG